MRIDRVRGRGIAAALPILLALSAASCSRESLAETGGTGAEAALADVRPDEMWSIVESFSKIDRTSSSPGELQAAAQLEAALERLGIPYRRHEIRAYISIPVSASLEIRSPERFESPPSRRRSAPRRAARVSMARSPTSARATRPR